MGNAPMATVLRHIRRLATRPADEQPSDRQLLERFASQRDESAFAALLRRHGPMVLSVCLNILRDAHAAEDAFQATFLVLVRKAGSIQCGESVGGWLYQVAHRSALRARSDSARLPDHDQRAEVMASADPWLDMSLRELREAVGEELGRLPDKYRTPLVLCYLEGKTQDEAARLLGDSPGSVKGRLERGRKRLRARLTRRGLALPAGLFATALAQGAASARVPAGLAASTVKAAVAAAGGNGLIGVSAEVAALVQGVSQSMASKLKIVAVLVCAAFGLAGAGTLGYPVWAARQGYPPAAQPAPAAKPAAQAAPRVAAPKGETLQYTGKVTDKDTGKPVAGATVTVRRLLRRYPTEKEENRTVEETQHVTDAQGKYSFTIPPEQSAKENLTIQVFVEHPDYATLSRSGGALSEIRKNEKLGGRPSFEHVELWPGTPVTGTVQTPEGQPAGGVKVRAYSVTSRGKSGEFASFSTAETRTDAQGRFRLPLPTLGFAVVWLLPEQHAPSTHVLKNDRRGDLGTLTLRAGFRLRGQVLDAKGQPVAGVYVNAAATESNEDVTDSLANSYNREVTSRSSVTGAKGEFEMQPLPPGKYAVHPDESASDRILDWRNYGVRPLSAVFVATRVTLREGAEPEPVEVRATPHVVIEAQLHDSKGQPTPSPVLVNVSGQMDKGLFWRGQVRSDADGKLVAYVPHGLENARLSLNIAAFQHSALRWRKSKDGPLNNSRDVNLGTVTDDVKGIEVVQYSAPMLLVKVSAKDGQKLNDPAVTAAYGQGRGLFPFQPFVVSGRPSDVQFVPQEDGRFRSAHLFPDEETTVTVHADGYASQSVQMKLPEGETKEIEIVLEKAPQKKDEKK